MNLYLLSQTLLDGFDTYDICVVAAINEDEARTISPKGGQNKIEFTDGWDEWPGLDRLDCITVKLLGEAVKGTESGVICASFNAG